jgi:hypothetical protein
MEARQSSTGWVAAAALGLGVLMACLAGERDPEWTGIIRDTCGPADGPAISIRVEEGASAVCPDSLAPDTATALHRLSFDGFPVDSLKPGATYRDSGVLCLERCRTTTYWSLTVESIDKEAVWGDLWIATTGQQGEARRERRGQVKLRRCSRVHPFCG